MCPGVCKSASLQGGGFIITKAKIKKKIKKKRTDDCRHCVSQKARSERKNATTEGKEMEGVSYIEENVCVSMCAAKQRYSLPRTCLLQWPRNDVQL